MDYTANATFEYSSAIRGYHFYKNTWLPEKGQKLDCNYERDNMFDWFAIKVCEKKSDKIVGHLPKEVSRITKFILNRGAIITAEITLDHYRRSPLVQGGLEVPCKIKVTTPPYFNMNVLKKYEDLVKELYVEPKNEEILGTFVDIQSQDTEQNHEESLVRKRKKPKTTSAPQVKSRDIRDLFKPSGQIQKKKQKEIVVINLDDSDSGSD